MSRRHPIVEPALSCTGCKSYEQTTIFELCLRAESQYHVAEKQDYHTCGHMRGERGACGPDRKLFSK